MVTVLTVLVCLMVLFWGSGVGPHGPRLMLFGVITLYEEPLWLLGRDELRDLVRAEILRLMPPADSEEDPEDEFEDDDSEERNLWTCCDDAGFETIDDNRDLRLLDVGCINWFDTDFSCSECDGSVVELTELYQVPSPHPNLVGRVKENPLGHVCTACGKHTLPKDEPMRPVGVIAPVIGEGANFFDVLAHFEALRKPKIEPMTEPATPAPSEAIPEQHPDPIGTAYASTEATLPSSS